MTNVISLASRSAAPTTPAQGVPPPVDPHQVYADAHNALTMAAHYLRQPTLNVPGAMRKTAQALAALRRLDAMVQGGAV